MEGHVLARHDRRADFRTGFTTEAEFRQCGGAVVGIDRVDLLPLALRDGDSFYG